MPRLHDLIQFWLIAAILVAVTAVAFGPVGTIIVFAVCSLVALREFMTLTYTRRADHWALLAAFFVVLPFQYMLIASDWYGMASIMIPVYAFLGMPIVSVLRRDTTRFMERVAETQWGLMTCVYCLSYVPALLMLPIEGYNDHGLLLILFLALAVQGPEWLFEASKNLLPGTSAAKALAHEFLIVGASGAVIGALLSSITPFAVIQAAALASVVAMLGLAGSLVMEAVRRDRGVEDWPRSHRFDRHAAGVLDRLERIIFSAPVFFHLVRFWWTP